MKFILIPRSFRGQIKKNRKYFQESDIVIDVKDFILNGLRRGESFLKAQEVFFIHIQQVKLRVCFHNAHFRYLLGIINDREFVPIIIDKKTGKYGKNLSLKASTVTVNAIQSATVKAIEDYLSYQDDKDRMTVYKVEESITPPHHRSTPPTPERSLSD